VARATIKPTETGTMKESTEKRDRTQEKYHVRNPENHPYHEGEKNYRRIDRKDRNKQQFDENGEVVDSSDEDFEQPSDKDTQRRCTRKTTRQQPKKKHKHRPRTKDKRDDRENKMMIYYLAFILIALTHE
jgi:hypothetical protein